MRYGANQTLAVNAVKSNTLLAHQQDSEMTVVAAQDLADTLSKVGGAAEPVENDV